MTKKPKDQKKDEELPPEFEKTVNRMLKTPPKPRAGKWKMHPEPVLNVDITVRDQA